MGSTKSGTKDFKPYIPITSLELLYRQPWFVIFDYGLREQFLGAPDESRSVCALPSRKPQPLRKLRKPILPTRSESKFEPAVEENDGGYTVDQ